MFRPGFVQPVKGVRSRTRLYNALYTVLAPLYPILDKLAPAYVTTTEKLGLAMIRAARDGAAKPILDTRDINALAGAELSAGPLRRAASRQERTHAT